jgi:hypothetical protein
MNLLTAMALAAHQGEEFVIILPAIMLVGAFFIMRWANQKDEGDDDEGDDDEAAEDRLPPEDRPVGLVLPGIRAGGGEAGAAPLLVGQDGDETTR